MKIKLPKSDYPLLIRTDFNSEEKWNAIVNQIPSDTAIQVVNENRYEGLTTEQLPQFEVDQEEHDFVFLADNFTMKHPEGAILCIDLAENFGSTFRVLPNRLFEVANNLFIVNVDFSDFENTTDSDGIYRGVE